MSCAEGHVKLVEFLLHFPYPERLKTLFKESSGDRMYRLGVPINAEDGHGRTPLHVAALYNKPEVVKLLLRFKVPVISNYSEGLISDSQMEGSPVDGMNQGRDVSPEIQDGTETYCSSTGRKGGPSEVFQPVEVDSTEPEGNTPLLMAVRGHTYMLSGVDRLYHEVAGLLLQHGADPNRSMVTVNGPSTALREACRKADVDMMALLLRHGAKDEEHTVLKMAIASRNWDMIGTMLQYKSHTDSEYKVNALAVARSSLGSEFDEDVMTTSGLGLRGQWPSVAVVINWHGLELQDLEPDWLYKACWQQTGRPPNDSDHSLTLFSITRVDLSRNKLSHLPAELFQMPSLRNLNASYNDLTELDRTPPPAPIPAVCQHCHEHVLEGTCDRDWQEEPARPDWNLPVLAELQLHHNSLREVPVSVFRLPSLSRLNVSHNKLDSMPYEMWSSPSLTELNLSHNQLNSLPYGVTTRALPIERIAVPDHPNSLSSMESLSSSLSGTPRSVASEPLLHRGVPMPLSLDLSSERLATPPGSLQSQGSASSGPHQDIPICFLNHWQDRLRVKITFSDDFGHPGMLRKKSNLLDLNLAHNSFQSIPIGLACLAPHLDRLNMSHNKLSQVGALENLPAEISRLDLSHNSIMMMGDVLFECSVTGGLETNLAGLGVRSCYNPPPQDSPKKG